MVSVTCYARVVTESEGIVLPNEHRFVLSCGGPVWQIAIDNSNVWYFCTLYEGNGEHRLEYRLATVNIDN